MSGMVERVARAIRQDWIEGNGKLPFKETDICWTTQARAALAAMRHPTSQMLDAAFMHERGEKAYLAAIDAALEG